MILISAVFENITELRPEACADMAKQGLLQWLMRRLRVKAPFDNNKLYASEILSILLQNTPENRQMIGDMDGIDVILQQLAVRLLAVNIFTSPLESVIIMNYSVPVLQAP